MFVKAKVHYIIGEDAGNAELIDNTLSSIGLKSKFFNDNPSILLNISYLNFLKKLPAETVFSVKIVSKNNNNNTSSFLIAIPFVSSHLGLPIKVGETIWLQEIDEISDVEKFYEINAYYLGRSHSYSTTEDASYCYDHREDEIFNINKKSFNLSISKKNQDTRKKLDVIKESRVRSNSIYVHDTVGNNKALSFLNDKNAYIKNSIKKYGLRAKTKFIKRSEDSVFQGTYNNMISLSSEIDEAEENFRYGNIELVAGHGEYTKNDPPEEFEFEQTDKNNFKISSKAKVRKFNADIVGTQIWNGIHYETIKSDMSFVNEGVINELGLNSYDINLLNNNSSYSSKSYDANASCFNVSEYNSKSIEIQKNNLINLSDITELSSEFLLSSSVENKNYFSIVSPITYPKITKSLLDTYLGGSSISGVADSIVFCTHKNMYSNNNNIKLIQVNSDDGLTSQISLNPSGNILIDGHKILIGSFNRLANKEHGQSATVYLGHSQENQSLVLGERLNDFLEEILSVQVEVFRLLKQILIELAQTDASLNNAISDLINQLIVFGSNAPTFVGPLSPIGVAVGNLTNKLIDLSPATTKIDEKNKEQTRFINEEVLIQTNEKYSLRIQNVIENLELLLSKFTKTSW